jgi:hypothetical protein
VVEGVRDDQIAQRVIGERIIFGKLVEVRGQLVVGDAVAVQNLVGHQVLLVAIVLQSSLQ